MSEERFVYDILGVLARFGISPTPGPDRLDDLGESIAWRLKKERDEGAKEATKNLERELRAARDDACMTVGHAVLRERAEKAEAEFCSDHEYGCATGFCSSCPGGESADTCICCGVSRALRERDEVRDALVKVKTMCGSESSASYLNIARLVDETLGEVT